MLHKFTYTEKNKLFSSDSELVNSFNKTLQWEKKSKDIRFQTICSLNWSPLSVVITKKKRGSFH